LIPIAYLREWSAHAPWPDLRQVEQDLIISRALCGLFASERLQGKISFRGGTAIHKLLFARSLRYSEDIDLVQTQAERIPIWHCTVCRKSMRSGGAPRIAVEASRSRCWCRLSSSLA
jgi:predicted nucleotidyltransferase component of viral defense system